MELLSLKIIILTLSGMIRLFFGMIPIVLLRCLSTKFRESRLKLIISILMFFGGGVLLATCFLHMMPEVRESYKTALPDLDFPVAEIIFIAGFFLVYLLENAIHGCIDRRRSLKRRKKGEANKSVGSSISENLSSVTDEKSFQANLNGAYQSTGDITATPTKPSSKDGNNLPVILPRPSAPNNNHHHPNPVRSSYPGEIIPVGGVNVLPRLATGKMFPNNNHQHQHHPGSGGDNNLSSNMTHQNNMKNDPSTTPNATTHFGTEKFSYVDPDWWRDTVIANSQMNLLSTSSFSVASSTGVPETAGGKEVIGSHRHSSHHHPHNHNLHHRHETHNNPGAVAQESPPHHKKGVPALPGSRTSTASTTSSTAPSSSSSGHDHHHHEHGAHSHVPIGGSDDEETSIAGSIRNLLIVIAISFHGIFEGLAIGIQPTAKDLWYLFLAVSLHECTILFCIGVELISSKTRVSRMITYILVVSLVSPIGIAMGIVISERAFSDQVVHALVIGTFQGLAAGTLLYVCFFEIFAAEGRRLERMKGFHIFVAMVGFALMTSLELMGGHKHGGPSGHSHSHGNATDGHEDHDHDAHAPQGFHGHEDSDDHHHHHHDHSH